VVHKDFKIKNKTFRRRKLSILQHKLRVIMKCYTVVDFNLDHETNEFTFKKTHKINGLKMDDPKEHSGRYVVEDLSDGNINLRLIVGESNKDNDADK